MTLTPLIPNDEPKVFTNQDKDKYEFELSEANRLEIYPLSPNSEGFEILKDVGAEIKWVVTVGNELFIIPFEENSNEVSHAVAANNKDVIAAGHAGLFSEGGTYIDRHSGHYEPSEASLNIGIEAFRAIGIEFLEVNYTIPD